MHGLHILVRTGIAVALVAGMSACAGATGSPEPQDGTAAPTVDDSDASPTVSPTETVVGELSGEGPYQRFIVKYREGSVAGESAAAARTHLQASDLDGIAMDQSLQLQWQRRLGMGADVFITSRPLDGQQATALMKQLGSDPQVEYIEIDGVMTIQQGSEVPPPQMLGGG